MRHPILIQQGYLIQRGFDNTVMVSVFRAIVFWIGYRVYVDPRKGFEVNTTTRHPFWRT